MTMDTTEPAGDALRALLASLQSERAWRNIQKPVEGAIRRLVGVVAAQQQQLDAIASRLAGLEATRDEQLRATETRLETLRSDIAAELKSAMKASHAQLTERVCAHVDARLVAQRDELDHTWTGRREQQQRVEESTRREEMRAIQQQMVEEIARHRLKGESSPRVEEAKLDTLERKLKKLEKQQRMTESAFTSQWNRWQGELAETLQAKVSQLELHAAVDAQTQAVIALREQVDAFGATDCMSRWETHQCDHRKVDDELKQLKSHMHELLGIVETLQGEQTMLKALTVDHVQNNSTPHSGEKETDTKRAVLKLHDAVKSVRRSVESVAKRAELEALSEQVAWLRKQLRSEIYQARYIWKEGRPTPKQTIEWTAQVVNTNSDVFVWQRSAGDAVTTMVPGLYHLQAAFFTSLEPVLQVLVNGEPALITTTIHEMEKDENTAPDPQNQTKPMGSARRRRLHHSAGDLVGVEVIAFLALPAHAVITIGYDIDERAQGFLNLRKL